MTHAGARNTLVVFRRRVDTPDAGGGFSSAWSEISRCWARFRPERGIERLQAGRVNAVLAGVLTAPSSTETRALDEACQALIDGQDYQIRSIADPDGRNKDLEITVERGVAQ